MACAYPGDKLTCSICKDKYEEPVPWTCGHFFCRVCIEWELEWSDDFMCPDCPAPSSTMACADLGDKLTCSLCKDIYEEPEKLKCGHIFCRMCIELELGSHEGFEDFSCPDCPAAIATASASSSAGACGNLEDELTCSICLNIYKDPVTLRCGHNFCQECIDNVLDAVKGSGAYSCPECREEFQERPTLHRNVALANIAERFQSAPSEKVGADFLCTYCIHSPTPAVKSCLHCEASLCESHLRVHNKSEEHVLTDPTVFLGSKRCLVHNKILQYYCPKDATCICLLCQLAGDHIGHQVEPLTKANEKKKEKVKNVLKKMMQNKKITEERLQSLKEEQHKKTSGETERVTALFQSIRRMLDELEKKVLRQISSQDSHRSLISDLIREMEIKKDEIYSKICHLEELCHMTDPWSILQDPQSSQEDFFVVGEEAILVESKDLQAPGDLDKVQISEMLYKGFTDIMSHAKKRIYDHEETDLSLNMRTAGINVELSDDLKVASWTQIKQIHWGARQNLHRCQVLSSQRFTSGRHYWDVETSKSGSWCLGVCYTSMPRSGDKADIGYNNKSWCLSRVQNSNQYSLMHDDKEILIYQTAPCHRFRLYLDYEAGQLFFYELSEPIRHIYTVTAKFKEPLLAAFYVCNAWVRIWS